MQVRTVARLYVDKEQFTIILQIRLAKMVIFTEMDQVMISLRDRKQLQTGGLEPRLQAHHFGCVCLYLSLVNR